MVGEGMKQHWGGCILAFWRSHEAPAVAGQVLIPTEKGKRRSHMELLSTTLPLHDFFGLSSIRAGRDWGSASFSVNTVLICTAQVFHCLIASLVARSPLLLLDRKPALYPNASHKRTANSFSKPLKWPSGITFLLFGFCSLASLRVSRAHPCLYNHL